MIDHFGAPWVARDKYILRDDARRFETWENSYALRAGFGAAFDYAESIGIDAIQHRVTELSTYCRSTLREHAAIELRDIGKQQCGIVSFTACDSDPADIIQKMAAAGIVIGSSPVATTRIDAERRNLPTVLRIAPHYYNTKDEIDEAVGKLMSFL